MSVFKTELLVSVFKTQLLVGVFKTRHLEKLRLRRTDLDAIECKSVFDAQLQLSVIQAVT